MNAILSDKVERAVTALEGIGLPTDWRAERAKTAHDWLTANGLPHRRDVYWGYTDPRLLDGTIGGVHDHDVPRFETQLGDATLTPLADAPFDAFGSLITKAHTRAPRPMAELTLMKADGYVLRVTGEGGHLALDRDEWGENFYLAVIMDEGSSITVTETGSKPALRNAVIEVFAPDNARFDHIRLSRSVDDIYHAHIFAELGAHAHFHSFTLAHPSQFRRFETIIDLSGEHGHLSVAGANLLTGECVHDDTVYVTHNAPNCTSRQVFKRVVTAKAKSIFQGKIYVDENAQKTDGYQISQGLMLEDGADILTKPELEIYADDVVCSHGSTTSGLDEDARFYLESRGIGREMANKLLTRAFINDAIEEVRDESLRATVTELAENWIFGQAL